MNSARDWVRHTVWWQVYPLGLLGADPTGHDRRAQRTLADLVPWLDYAIELGASGLALGPVFASDTHGYDTRDHFHVDERLGTDDDLDTLIAACHERGLQVMLDGVFNHVGRHHPAFRRLQDEGPDADTAELFVREPGDGPPRYRTFEGHDGLVTLNHASGAVADAVTAVMRHWLARGIDAWRLDAAYAVPTEFWAEVLPRVRADHPHCYVLGEVIHGDYGAIVAASDMDTVTQYELWKAIGSALADRNLYELAWALDRHNGMLEQFVPWTFLSNHDVTRIASRLPDPALLAVAVAVWLTLGGTPAVYYGDEQGFTGIKEERFGGDDAIRPALPEAPSQLPPDGRATYRLYQRLIGLRRRNPWLHAARTQMLHLANEQASYRVAAGDDALVVAVNLATAVADVPVPGAGTVVDGTVVDGTVAGSGSGPVAGIVRLPGPGWAVLAPQA